MSGTFAILVNHFLFGILEDEADAITAEEVDANEGKEHAADREAINAANQEEGNEKQNAADENLTVVHDVLFYCYNTNIQKNLNLIVKS